MSSITLKTPIGPIIVSASGDRLDAIRMCGTSAPIAPEPDDDTPLLREAAAQLNAWFAHRLTTFDLPLVPGKSPRGEALRAAIAAIPYGQTASYGALARIAASGPRAIGQACRRNPFTIVIPCHRVIGAQQTIGHYSGGDGIVTKRWLLDHERRNTS